MYGYAGGSAQRVGGDEGRYRQRDRRAQLLLGRRDGWVVPVRAQPDEGLAATEYRVAVHRLVSLVLRRGELRGLLAPGEGAVDPGRCRELVVAEFRDGVRAAVVA